MFIIPPIRDLFFTPLNLAVPIGFGLFEGIIGDSNGILMELGNFNKLAKINMIYRLKEKAVLQQFVR